MASTYHQLGMVVQDWGRVDEAEEWYRRALAIEEELGDRPTMAKTHGQLGLLAEARGRRAEALDWTVRCVAHFEQFPHPATGPGPAHLAGSPPRSGSTPSQRPGGLSPDGSYRRSCAISYSPAG
jgi:tetratricopeptide (TPR) repeat protein